MTGHRGVSLIEVVIASVIAALVAGGTMMAFVMAAGISQQDTMDSTEAVFYAEHTLERLRNHIACDDGWFGAGCTSSVPPGWTSDPLPTPPAGVESPLVTAGGTRDYEVVPADCDGVGGAGDCFRVTTRVQWTGAN
jgi:prepilin-type N-terminal cleavage/methylation domain-containing protein